MLAYLKHYYFLVHGYPKDISNVSINDLTKVNIFRITVPNLEGQIKFKNDRPNDYKSLRKWDLQPDISFLEYDISDPEIAKKVFQTFQKSIDHVLSLYN